MQVYLPICIEQRYWFLVSVDLRTLHMKLYFTNSCVLSGDGQSTIIQVMVYPILIKFESLFKAFLDNISYWEHSGRNSVEKLLVSSTEVWPQDKGNIGCNSVVLVCMLMRNLVLNLPMNIEGELEEACSKYRKFMADEFYAGRWLPKP